MQFDFKSLLGKLRSKYEDKNNGNVYMPPINEVEGEKKDIDSHEM